MSDIVKVYRQEVPALRFIGKKYGDSDRVNGNFGKLWDDWFSSGWFDQLEKKMNGNLKSIYEDGDAYIGLMRFKEGEPFEYSIGIFMPPGTEVPDGFTHIDFPQLPLGVCWLYGTHADIYAQEDRCAKRLEEEGWKIVKDKNEAYWFMERYGCPRFTTPDGQGKIILDICWHIE